MLMLSVVNSKALSIVVQQFVLQGVELCCVLCLAGGAVTCNVLPPSCGPSVNVPVECMLSLSHGGFGCVGVFWCLLCVFVCLFVLACASPSSDTAEKSVKAVREHQVPKIACYPPSGRER